MPEPLAAAPIRILSLMASGAPVMRSAGCVGDVGLPDDLAGLLVGRDHARRLVGDRDDEIAPERDAAVGFLPLLLRVHAPDDAPDVAGAAVDLVDDAGGIRDVDEAVLDQRRRLVEAVADGAAERHRVGELEALDVVLVDARERREALAVIGAVVHQPVLRLLVGVDEPLGRDIGRHGWHGCQCGAGEHRHPNGLEACCAHVFSPFVRHCGCGSTLF